MKKILLVMVILLNMMGVSHADEVVQLPHLMNLQTLIYDSDGNLSSSETVDLTIRILDENQHVIYSESQPGIPVVNGAVNISVGSNQPLTADILDPALGEKFLDIAVGAENPFESMPLVAVPYSLWAEKALTVPDDSIESRHIKNGTIKVEDLEALAFSQLTGQVSDTQIPSTIARGSDLTSHIRSTSAHPASAITVSGHFVTIVAQNVQEFLEKIDGKLSEEIVNRRNAQGDTVNQTTNLQNALNSHISGSNTTAHTFGNISGQISDSQIPASITRDSEAVTLQTNIDSKVSKSGDVMTGNLSFNNSSCSVPPGATDGIRRCLVDGVDVSNLDSRVQTVENRFNDAGQVTDNQVPQYMRPAAFGNITVQCNYTLCDTGSCPLASVSGLSSSNLYNVQSMTLSNPSSPSLASVRINFQNPVPATYSIIPAGPGSDPAGFNYYINGPICPFQTDGSTSPYTASVSFLVFKN